MNTNEKGVRGLIKVIDDLQSNGYYVFNAFDDHSPVDVIAMDKTGKTFRIQIKYRQATVKKNKGNTYNLGAFSIVNCKKIEIDRTLIDGWAVYMADDNKVVYIPVRSMEGKKETTLYGSEKYGELTEWQCAGLLNQDH